MRDDYRYGRKNGERIFRYLVILKVGTEHIKLHKEEIRINWKQRNNQSYSLIKFLSWGKTSAYFLNGS